MNIDRYGTQVEDADRYCHIYRSKYWYPAWIHSALLSAKGKMLPTLNASLVTQQPETSCQSYCCALISEENGGGRECLHLWLSGLWGLHKPTDHFVWAPEMLSLLCRGRECICLPQEFLGEQEESRLLPKVSKSCIRKIISCHLRTLQEFPSQ